MVDVKQLKAAMDEKAISIDEAAKAIGVDRSTLYRRLERDGAKFTVEEVRRLAELLAMSPKAMNEIFFARELA